MKNVAELAGVAPITVSRFLQDHSKVSEGLREKIQSAIEQLEYIPNRMAGGLSSSSAPVVPIIVPAIRHAVFSEMILAAQQVLLQRDLQVFIGNTDYSLSKEEALVSAFVEWYPKALIITGMTHTERTTSLLCSSGIPIIELMEVEGDPIDTCVGFSDFNVGKDITSWLIKRGYSKITFLGAMLERDVRARLRMKGFQSAIEEAGLPLLGPISLEQETSFSVGDAVLRRVRQMDVKPQAIVCASDILALAVMFACQKQGVSIPKDLAVTGVQDLPISKAVHPGLTTVRTPRSEVGRVAAEIILRRLSGQDAGGTRFDLGYEIIERESA